MVRKNAGEHDGPCGRMTAILRRAHICRTPEIECKDCTVGLEPDYT